MLDIETVLVSAERLKRQWERGLRRRGRDDRSGVVCVGNGEGSELTGTDHSFGDTGLKNQLVKKIFNIPQRNRTIGND